MRPYRTILALAIVLGFAAGEARAWQWTETKHDYTVAIAGHKVGFSDGTVHGNFGYSAPWQSMHLGPFGDKPVPFTAPQGIAFCGLSFGLLLFAALAIIVWRRRLRAEPAELPQR